MLGCTPAWIVRVKRLAAPARRCDVSEGPPSIELCAGTARPRPPSGTSRHPRVAERSNGLGRNRFVR